MENILMSWKVHKASTTINALKGYSLDSGIYSWSNGKIYRQKLSPFTCKCFYVEKLEDMFMINVCLNIQKCPQSTTH